jgi:hypothetical protein
VAKWIERLMRDFVWEGMDEGKKRSCNKLGIGDTSKRMRWSGGGEIGQKRMRLYLGEMAMEI